MELRGKREVAVENLNKEPESYQGERQKGKESKPSLKVPLLTSVGVVLALIGYVEGEISRPRQVKAADFPGMSVPPPAVEVMPGLATPGVLDIDFARSDDSNVDFELSKGQKAIEIVRERPNFGVSENVIGAALGESVSLSELGRAELSFVAVNGNRSWTEIELGYMREVLETTKGVIKKVGGSFTGVVPEVFVDGKGFATVNIIKPEREWKIGGWGFNNQGYWGLAIFPPDSDLTGEEYNLDNDFITGLSHEATHAFFLLPLIRDHPEYDFALVEGSAELVSRLVAEKYTNNGGEYRYNSVGQLAHPTSFCWFSNGAEHLLSSSEKYDYVGLAFLWLHSNRPEVIPTIREMWLDNFRGNEDVSLDEFLEWGQKGWEKSSVVADPTFPGGFKDFWMSTDILKVSRNGD